MLSDTPHPYFAIAAMQGFESRASCEMHAELHSPGPYTIRLVGVTVRGVEQWEWFYPREPQERK